MPALRQDPFDLSFRSLLTFVHHGVEEVETHLLRKVKKQFEGKVGQMCHRSCSLAWGFYTKLYTKSAVSESSIALGRLKLLFLPLRLSLWHLAHLFIMFMATKPWLRFFILFIYLFIERIWRGLASSMKLIWGLSPGKWNDNTKKNKEQKRCWNINTKIQIKMGKHTKGMRENN